ncbi:MAG: YajQ family cyclic di-GMP-binding protein [Deltaproteobacteria bacterium]|nr:YajQ family cyclic di-GMP-binding protein [Deltaproteobacteria bacterium]
MPSFDIVNELNMNEVDNAVNQAAKEIQQRYDFKGSNSTVEREEKIIKINSQDEAKVNAVIDVLQSKMAKRGISIQSLDIGKVEPAGGGRAKVEIKLKEGIDKEQAKNIVKKIKDTKLKVQPSIQGDTVRVSGKKIDDLQEVIGFLKGEELSIPVDFQNFRD